MITSWLQKHGPIAFGALGAGLILGMTIHAFTFTTSPPFQKGTKTGPLTRDQKEGDTEAVEGPPHPAPDLSSSRQLVQAMFPGARIGGGEKSAPLDPVGQQIQGILRNPNSSYQKVATLMNLAKTLPLDRRRVAYAGAAFVCGPQEFQQLMLPLVWDPATPSDQAQVLAGGVVGLPDPVRLPICLTFLKHRDESIRMTGEAVLSAYFPDVDPTAYPSAVQAYLAHPD